jgi:hypothetical protein
MYSFSNFPETSSNALKLTPRSNEAMKRTGYKVEDLIVKTVD